MSRQQDDGLRPPRPRAPTSSFPSLAWPTLSRPDHGTAQAPSSTATLSLEALIDALTPPAAPSPNYARALVTALSNRSPMPRLSIVSPVIARLCAPESPQPLQIIGYDVLAAYWENNGAAVLTVADRLACFSLFLDPSIIWSQELWEPRFKAMYALIQSGTETMGMETNLLKVVRSWIEGAFEGLVASESGSVEERLERQRSVETLSAFIAALVSRTEFISRLTDADTTGVLKLYGQLLDRAFLVQTSHSTPSSVATSPIVDTGRKASSPYKPTHRRGYSSLSLTQIPTHKHPADIAAEAFLGYLSIRLKTISPDYLEIILAYLFRALAFFASPLPRISLTPNTPHQNPNEKRIVDVLDSLVAGPYSSKCTQIMKRSLFPSQEEAPVSIRTSLGAIKALRIFIRRVLIRRLARAYIGRANSMDYTPSGAPGHITLDRDLMEWAWAKDEVATWDMVRFRNTLCNTTKAWIDEVRNANILGAAKEAILCEIAGILKDMMQAFDERGEGEELDDEEVAAVGAVLQELVAYVRSLKNPDGGPMSLLLSTTHPASPFLNILSILLTQDLISSPLYSVLPPIILSIADHLADHDTAQLLRAMDERHSLSPTIPAWLNNWGDVLAIPNLYTPSRPLTRQVALDVLQSVWTFVKDIPVYRRPLANLVFQFWKQQTSDEKEDLTATIIWRILGDEVVLRSDESLADETAEVAIVETELGSQILAFLITTAASEEPDEDDAASIRTTDTHSPPVHGPFSPVTTAISTPVMSRVQSDFQAKESTMSNSVMSLLTSFTSGNSSRSQSQPPSVHDHPVAESSPMSLANTEQAAMPKSVGAVVALVSIFCQLAFTPLALSERNLQLATRVFRELVAVIGGTGCVKARLTAMQFFMRLRADRDHKLYIASADRDIDGSIFTLASLINRGDGENNSTPDDRVGETNEVRKARTRVPQERDGRRLSRGRGGLPSQPESSRSRSRVTARMTPLVALATPPLKHKGPLWSLPEYPPFPMSEADTTSEGLTSYDPEGSPTQKHVLPLSSYLGTLVDIIATEKDWEILSYVLCHLPVQLANKHLFCGPKSRLVIVRLVTTLCSMISDGKLAANIERWPVGIAPRDAQGIAYHTLTVLISYKRCFRDVPGLQLRHHIVEVFYLGLSGQPSTIKCCLHALALSAFELQPSITKYLSRILEKLSQIMSNEAMAVHIIDFLAIVGSLKILHANFTSEDYKMVFGVAMQYLQHHNHPEGSQPISWALSQHVRVMSYYIVYLWFIAMKLPDRPQHVKYIARQLLLANGGKDLVDEPSEVCFDFLARYTYGTADPRPANSLLNDIVMNPVSAPSDEPALIEKTWILGHSVITIRSLKRRGWVEVLSRRASGLTKFLCRAENVPMVTVGDVDPDMLSIPAMLTMDRSNDATQENANEIDLVDIVGPETESPNLPRPDPITGYVWSGTAPSQRRKDVAIDPGYFALQLSSFPDNTPSANGRLVEDNSKVGMFIRSLDRMPVIDTHKVGILYVAPGQTHEIDILRNTHGSPAYTRFLEGLGRLINLRGQADVYGGGLHPDEDGEYAYAWWDDIGQILFHTATLMPSDNEEFYTNKKRHIGNDYVRIVWNDSGMHYKFDTLATQFQFVNIVIEPHSRGAIAAFSNSVHENEYFKVTVQRAPGMTEFSPIGDFKLISAQSLPLLVRQLSLLTDWFVSVFQFTKNDTERIEMPTNWRSRLQAIKQFRDRMAKADPVPEILEEGVIRQEIFRDFTSSY